MPTCNQTGPNCSGEARTSLRPKKCSGKNTKIGRTIMPVTAPVTYKLTTFDVTSLARTDRWETA
jgi:hypothetical protein